MGYGQRSCDVVGFASMSHSYYVCKVIGGTARRGLNKVKAGGT